MTEPLHHRATLPAGAVPFEVIEVVGYVDAHGESQWITTEHRLADAPTLEIEKTGRAPCPNPSCDVPWHGHVDLAMWIANEDRAPLTGVDLRRLSDPAPGG